MEADYVRKVVQKRPGMTRSYKYSTDDPGLRYAFSDLPTSLVTAAATASTAAGQVSIHTHASSGDGAGVEQYFRGEHETVESLLRNNSFLDVDWGIERKVAIN